MNTLLGELGTYNDLQYPRHRFAFKLRKLQATFLLGHLESSAMQEILHSTGVQPLPVDDELTEVQIRSVFAEIFTSIKSSTLKNVSRVQFQEAQITCLNWFLMAFQVDTYNKATVGRMKIALTLFCGSKAAEKAKYLFSVLAKNGTLGKDGLQYFCETIQIIADCLSEVVYSDLSSIDRALSECLYLVRDYDDIVDEEEDGGIQRPWLSCNELVKVFTASPPLNFLSWMDLWFSLPQMEKVIHHVKCSICNRKSIIGFRYQCSECSNYHMCQMCFLKGRTSEPHALEHKVYECTSYSKGLKNLFAKNTQPKDSRVMDDLREPPSVRLNSGDYLDGSTNSLQMIGHIRSPSETSEPPQRPTELRIGSRTSLNNSPLRTSTHMEPNSNHRLSLCSTTSSESNDSRYLEGSMSPMGILNQGIGDVGVRKPSPIISSLKRTGPNSSLHHSLQRISRNEGSPMRKSLTPTHSLSHSHAAIGRRYTNPESRTFGKTASDGVVMDDFSRINQKLSLEVDQLLKDMEPEVSPVLILGSENNTGSTNILDLIEEEEKVLKLQMENAQHQKSKLTTDLDSFLNQVQSMHSGFSAMKQGHKVQHHQLHLQAHHERGGSLDMYEAKKHSTPYLLNTSDSLPRSTQRISAVY